MTRTKRPTLTQILLPAGPLVTPFNIVAGIILSVGAVLILYRFLAGLGATTNLSHTTPWGLWVGMKLCFVALAGGAFSITTAVYLFGMKEYKPLARPAVLTGMLCYSLFIGSLILDLGRYYRLPYPFVVQAGPTSFLFEISLCVALYLNTLVVEFTPAAFEWFGLSYLRKIIVSMTFPLTVFGLLLSTLHQSSLGALYLVVPLKLHPLWHSPYVPLYFLISAIAGGISMAILQSVLCQRVYGDKMDISRERLDALTVGLAKAGALTLAVYLGVKIMGIALGNHWALLTTPMGYWFLFEHIGFVLLPCFLFAIGFRERRVGLIRATAVLTAVGIVLNRLNIAMIAFNWKLPAAERYIPHWIEIWISLTLICAGVVAFRWIANRMPVLYEHPDYRGMH